jgi:AcrR family transcriptional regulator
MTPTETLPAAPAEDAAPPEAKRPRGRPRKTEDERDDGNRRHELLKAAAQLFRRQGFAATTTRDIANAAGMQSGSPFYHFKSKDALLFAVMEAGMHSALANQQRVLGDAAYAALSPADKLRRLVHAHFEVLLGPGNDFVPVMLYEWRSLQRPQRKVLHKLIADYEALWMPVLQALQSSGQLKAPVGVARLLILGALNWSVQWFDPAKGATVEALGEHAVAMFIQEV